MTSAPKMWILLMQKDADTIAPHLKNFLETRKTVWHPYIHKNYEIVPYLSRGFRSFKGCEYYVRAIRHLGEKDAFMFVYPESYFPSFTDYVVKRNPAVKGRRILGLAIIDRGIAFVAGYGDGWYYDVLHEWTHIAQCGTWENHDDLDHETLGKIIRRPDADKYPWCKCKEE